MLRGLLFDKDGTLFDFQQTWGDWAARALHRLAGGDLAQVARLSDVVGYDLVLRQFRADSPAIAGTNAEIAVLLAPHLPDWPEEALLAEFNTLGRTVTLVEAAPLAPLLSGLAARNLYLGVATNDSEENAREHLAEAGVAAHFDRVLGYDSGFGAKPEPGMLLAFCDEIGLPPREVAMVGDSLHDLRAGRAAGMTAIGVLTGLADAAELAPCADLILPDIGHLPAWLDTQRLPRLRRRQAGA